MLRPIRKYRVIASVIWIGTVLLSFCWNYFDDIQERNVIALESARAFLTYIVGVRAWNLEHGGVFVLTDEKSPPTPYLPENQQYLATSDGRMLTRLHPAYMTRQIFEIVNCQSKIRLHLTSLHPIRPENKAQPWEEAWLQELEQEKKERGEFVDTPDGKIFRYMAPLYVTEPCLACHQDAREGDMRGGIALSLPLDFRKSFWPLLISHGAAVIMGLFCINFFANRLRVRSEQLVVSNQHLLQEIDEHKQSEQELVKIKEELETRVAARTAEMRSTNILLDAKVKEQQRVEKALVASNDEFIQIFNSAPDGMHIVDRDFTIVRANRAFMTLTQQSGARIIGRKCHEVFAGALCNTPECPLIRILGGEKRVDVESRKIRADGGSFPCAVTATPFCAPSGELIGIIEVTRDISSWKEVEHALSQSAHDLLLRNQELQDFSHVISHDLQEPLTLIQAFGQRLRDNFPKTLSEKAGAYLERIINSAERMQMLINGLLYYSRIEKDAHPFTEVRLNALIQTVLEDLAVKIEESGAVISVDDLGVVVADPLQMRQLFQNIIGNSLKYRHPDRTPEIRVTRAKAPEGVDPDSHISISIKDNGIGFKEEYQEKIFDIFQRLHTRQQFQGTGIGLTICKKIVEHHHGLIRATAVQGEGAEFLITLPLTQG